MLVVGDVLTLGLGDVLGEADVLGLGAEVGDWDAVGEAELLGSGSFAVYVTGTVSSCGTVVVGVSGAAGTTSVSGVYPSTSGVATSGYPDSLGV